MSAVTSESITVSSHPGFVHVVLTQMRDSGVDMGGPLWVEHKHAAWIADQLDKVLHTYGSEGVEATLGDDQLNVYESGDERAPFFNVQNRRVGAAHAGVYALAMTRTAAEQLVRDLRAI
jgi:hypothetical protein